MMNIVLMNRRNICLERNEQRENIMTLPTLRSHILLVLCCVLSMAMLPHVSYSQIDRIRPISDYAGWFTLVGEMKDSIGFNAQFGEHIWPIGDCNHDGLSDWIVSRVRYDTAVDHFGSLKKKPVLLLYKGIKGGLPDYEDGKRIGITEQNSAHLLLGSGDWDADGDIDLAMRTEIYNDSSYGTRSADQFDVVIFWGNSSG